MRNSILDDTADIASRQRQINAEEGKGCQCCGTTVGVERKHQNTAYDYPAISKDPNAQAGDAEDPNYISLCPVCWVENEAHWKSMWDDYWSSRL